MKDRKQCPVTLGEIEQLLMMQNIENKKAFVNLNHHRFINYKEPFTKRDIILPQKYNTSYIDSRLSALENKQIAIAKFKWLLLTFIGALSTMVWLVDKQYRNGKLNAVLISVKSWSSC